MKILKTCLKKVIQNIVYFFTPKIIVNSKYKYDLLGSDDYHYFIGYYDKDPMHASNKKILCHQVSKKYSNMTEPLNSKLGLLSLETNEFKELIYTNAMNWQLGSRAQWLDEYNIIYNDIEDNLQCSVKFNIKTMKKVTKYKRPFWDISPNKKFGTSLNFSRIKLMRPGYGYRSKSIDNFDEILTVFNLNDDKNIFKITLNEILKQVNFINTSDNNIYLNHVVWSPCSKKFITIFHYEDKEKKKRMVYPVLINIETKKINFLYKEGSFSHHTFVDQNTILAYLKIKNEYCFATWTEDDGWIKIKNSMPKMDGHPTYIKSKNKIVVDSYPNRLGIMSLYFGSLKPEKKLEKIASIINHPNYVGANRCDLHPRYSQKHNLLLCDIPHSIARKILVIKNI